ncbi:MAG TPA: BON domain-containing protein, partial [Pyrinomonadaceae bacterium]|nr:BON domain-containing protein [Pyrinomonadaceae bacterium]
QGQQGSGTQGYGRQGFGGGQRSQSPKFGDDQFQGFHIGGHRGKGPKGYSRSDDRIKEEINEKLWFDDDLDASNIEVEVNSGEVTLTGTVEDRYTKRAAEDLVEGLSGVKHVQNNLRVDSGSSSPFTSNKLNENLETISGSENSESKASKKASGT